MTKNLGEELQWTARQALTDAYPVAAGDEPGGLRFGKLLAAVFRARYLVFGTTLFGLLIGSFLAITTPNTYVSTGKFLFTSSGAESRQQNDQESIGNAAPYILTTDALFARVIERVGPPRILSPFQPGGDGDTGSLRAFFYSIQRDWNAAKDSEITPEEALKRLRKTVSVDRPRGTDVLIATCAANDSRLAQEILGVYMEEAVKLHVETYDDPRVYDDAERNADLSSKARDAAHSRMREFLAKKAVVHDFEDERRRRIEYLADKTKALAEFTDDLAVAKRYGNDLQRRLTGEDAIPKTVVVERAQESSAEIEHLAQVRIAKRLELADALSRFREGTSAGDKPIEKLRKDIEEIEKLQVDEKAKLATAPKQRIEETNPAYEETVLERQKNIGQIDLLIAKMEQSEKAVAEAERREKQLADLQLEFEALREESIKADADHKSAQGFWEEAKSRRSLKLGNFSSLNAFEQASLPLDKEGPNRAKLLLGGFFVGLFLGLGIVLMRALPDTVARTREDLEQLDGLQVVGVMPRLDNRNLRRHRLLREQGW